MSVEKIDNTKFFMTNTQSVQNKQTEPAPVAQDEEKSNAAKYMIGATAVAATIAIGVVGHKNNWWKEVKNITPKAHADIKPNPPKTEPVKTSVNNITKTPQNVISPTPENTVTSQKRSWTGKIKDTVIAPFRKVKKRKEAKRLQKAAEQKAKREAAAKIAEEQKLREIQQKKAYRELIVADGPNRMARIAQKEEKYADRIKLVLHEDFGEIKDLGDDIYSCVKPSLVETHPEVFAPLPKKGEYNLNNFAVDGYWNGPEDCGACIRSYIRGLDLHYNNQFTIEDKFRVNSHWGVMKSVVRSYEDELYHRGTVLSFSCQKLAMERCRPLGWNIFIEGDIPLDKMKEIKKQLVESGVWAKQIAIQDNDTMIEVFNEIIKVLNR